MLEVAAGVAQKAGSADVFDVLFGRAAPVRKALSTVASWLSAIDTFRSNRSTPGIYLD